MITKNICKLIIIGIALLSLSACSESNNKNKLPNTQTSINKVLDEQVKSADNNSNTNKSDDLNKDSENKDSNLDNNNQNNNNSNTDNSDKKNPTDESIDYDLTTMSSEMVYATVFQLVTYPENYIGKKVKMGGAYYVATNEEVQKNYHYVIISDATACCTQGIEFVWDDGSHVFPDEYPAEGTEVEVVGIFESYIDEDDGIQYCRLKNSSMKIIE